MKSIKLFAVVVFTSIFNYAAFAQNSRTIVENAMASNNHTTLVAAIKAAELVEVLSSTGPFTVFAPTNTAFTKLPEGTVANLLLPENKSKLQAILTYHVVAGNLDSKAVVAAIKSGNGTATLTTVQGEKLSASLKGKNVVITDAKGNKATIVTVDIMSSNGVLHIIDNILLPKN